MNLAVHHMMGAALFAKRVREIEVQNKEQRFGDFFSEIIWHSSATTLLAVAAIEAYINEIFLDAKTNFPVDVAQIVAEQWAQIERTPTLKKYHKALRLKGAKAMEGSPAYQEMDNLIKARNALTHFQPQWQDEETSHREVEQRLKGKFPTSPFMDSGSTFFPNQCMTYGFTKWAVETAMTFSNEFSIRFAITNKFLKFKDMIELT